MDSKNFTTMKRIQSVVNFTERLGSKVRYDFACLIRLNSDDGVYEQYCYRPSQKTFYYSRVFKQQPFLFYMAGRRIGKAIRLSDCLDARVRDHNPFFIERCKVSGFINLMTIAVPVTEEGGWWSLIIARDDPNKMFSLQDKEYMENIWLAEFQSIRSKLPAYELAAPGY